MFVHYREKFFHVFLSKKQYFYFTAFIHSIRFSKIEQHNFSEKNIPDLWIAVQSIWNFREISQVFCTVIHRHNDERKTAARWQKLRKSGIMDSLRKGVPAMAIKYTEEQLNSVDKSMLIHMFLNQQEQLEKVSADLHSLDTKMQAMMEQLILANKNRFGRSSEKMEDTQQMRFIEVDGTLVFFNEAEAVCDLDAPEPETLEAALERKKKSKGKKAQDMSELSTNRIDHYMTEEELTAEFGENGWKQLPDAIARRYRFIPAKVEVDEHHVGVYASKADGHIVKAKHPKSLLHGSPVSASLAAAIMNGKYVNAVPLYRLEQEFIRYGIAITRQNMANWMIRLGEEYLSVLYDHLHTLLYGYHVIQADETPVLVNRDARSAGSKSYMWVYCSGHMYPEKQIILYEYQRTRNASHPREFLKDYSGICVTDGYQVYHTLEKEREDGNYRTDMEIFMDGMDVFNFAISVVPKGVKEVMKITDSSLEDIDYLVFHQSNKFMTDFFVKRLKFDETKVPYCIAKYGNTSSASVPLTIVSELSEKLNEEKVVVMCGFGAGLSWATARIVYNECHISPIIEY